MRKNATIGLAPPVRQDAAMRTLRFGLLGTGWIGERHIRSLLKVPGTEVVALCNHHLDKARAFSERVLGGAAMCYADFDAMLREQTLDALYICIPPGMHTGQAEAAARRGLHLMLEKPIALTLERGQSIADAVRAAGVTCAIGHHMRHTGPVRRLKQLIDDGTAGRPILFQGRWFANNLFPAWWRDPAIGGGQLVEQSIHLYDLARHFFGDAIDVVAFVDRLAHGQVADYRVDDVSAATVRFANGAIANICASNCADPTAGSVTFTVLCEKVYAEFKSLDEATIVHHGGRPAEQLKGVEVVREVLRSDGDNFDALAADFVGAIREGRPARSTIEDGLRDLQLVLGAQASGRAGGAVQRLSE